MSFRGRGNASGANRGGFGGGRGGENFPTWMRCEDVKGANEIFLLQVAEASSSHSAPQRRFWVIILLNPTIFDLCR
jgi:hypothetical protein